MPEHQVGAQPAASEGFEQPCLQREEGGLRELGQVQAGFLGPRLQFRDNREPGPFANEGIDLLHRTPEMRVFAEEAPAHPRPLGTVPREHEGDSHGSPDRLPRHEIDASSLGSEDLQAPGDLHRVAAEDDEAMIVVLAPPGRVGGGLSRGRRFGGEEELPVAGGELRQRARTPGGEHQGKRCSTLRTPGVRRRSAMLSQDNVGVGAAEAEGVDSERRRNAVVRQLGVLARHPDVELLERNVGIGGTEVERGGDGAVPEHEHRLEQARHPGSRLQVSEVGLYRSYREGIAGSARASQHAADRACLLRIAGRGTGAVGLDVDELSGIHPGVGVGAREQLLLGVRVRHRESSGTPVRVDRGTEDEGMNGIAVPARLRERLEVHHRTAFRAHIAVARGIESTATPGRREHRRLRETDEAEGGHEDVDAAGERACRFASPDAEAGLVQGHERGGAGGVHRHARTVEVEDVGDAVGGDAQCAAGHRVGVAGAGVVDPAVGVVGAGDPDVDGAVASREAFGDLGTVLQRLPGELEQEPLLRVHLGRLPGRYAEESGIEAIDVVEDSGRPGIASARRLRVGVVVVLGPPAPFVNPADEITSFRQALPERLRARCAAGKSAGHSYDGDGFFPLSQAPCLLTPYPMARKPAIPRVGVGLRSSIVALSSSRKAPTLGAESRAGIRIAFGSLPSIWRWTKQDWAIYPTT